MELFYILFIVAIIGSAGVVHIGYRENKHQDSNPGPSPFEKGYETFSSEKLGAKQSFIQSLLLDPRFVEEKKDGKVYRVRDIMHEVMVRYGDSWYYKGIEPHENPEDEEQFWLGAREAIVEYTGYSVKSESAKEMTLKIAQARQRAIDEIHKPARLEEKKGL